jgi:hypothetical protein
MSHALTRTQVIQLNYFKTVTRANRRLKQLRDAGLVKRLDTPFFSQGMYSVTHASSDILGENVGALVAGRTGSPRFIQHALSTTNLRIRLLQRGATSWKFEQQLRRTFFFAGTRYEVRPDGLAVIDKAKLIAVEVDLGHVAPAKFEEKLQTYQAFVVSGKCKELWEVPSFRLLTLSPGKTRSSRLAALTPAKCAFEHFTTTFEEFGVPSVGAWS